jgi:mannan endo-1,6-alpha-mannosidase
VTRTNGLFGAASTFFQGNTMAEKCEQAGTCDVDQLSFKSYLSRWLATASLILPSTAGKITPLLQTSAGGAVASCAGGPDSATCGTKWFTNNWDGTQGVGQQMVALEVVHGLLAGSAPPRSCAKRGVEEEFHA